MNKQNSEITPTDLLERLTDHEKECAKRWGETTVELRELKHGVYDNAKKWDRLNWYLFTGVAIVIGTNLAHVLKSW
tara:strand:+ start:564 stop:791 length:228 start_codon:yes stop_codon:yes gene_type:complete